MSDSGLIPLTKEVWDKILKHYLITYRGPDDEANLRRELDGFFVLTRTGNVNPGRFVRYMPKGILDNELRRGGYVIKCNSKTIHVESGTRQFGISRADNYIFVGNEMKKSETRKLMEMLLKADDERLASKQNYNEVEEDDDQVEPRAKSVKVNFV